MCEFKVKLNSENKVIDVCSEVLYAKIDENVTLRDILGGTNTVDSAIITEVSVPSAKLTLLHSPILKNILKLLKLQIKCYEEGKFDKKMIEVWEEVKKEGDNFLNSLRNKLS